MAKPRDESFAKKLKAWREKNVSARGIADGAVLDRERKMGDEKVIQELFEKEGRVPCMVCTGTSYYGRLGSVIFGLAFSRRKKGGEWVYRETSQYFPAGHAICNACHPVAPKALEEGRVVMGSTLLRSYDENGFLYRIGDYTVWAKDIYAEQRYLPKEEGWRQRYLKGMRNGEIRYSFKPGS